MNEIIYSLTVAKNTTCLSYIKTTELATAAGAQHSVAVFSGAPKSSALW
jgi:hypothetical protein